SLITSLTCSSGLGARGACCASAGPPAAMAIAAAAASLAKFRRETTSPSLFLIIVIAPLLRSGEASNTRSHVDNRLQDHRRQFFTRSLQCGRAEKKARPRSESRA